MSLLKVLLQALRALEKNLSSDLEVTRLPVESFPFAEGENQLAAVARLGCFGKLGLSPVIGSL